MRAFGTKTATRLLNLLLENVLQEFKGIELIKKAKTGKGSANKIIDKLVRENLVFKKRVEKTKLLF